MNNNPAPETYQVKAALAHREAFTVCGLSVLTDNTKAAEDINALWERFFKEQTGQKIPHRENDVIFAVYSDYQGDHTKPYRYTIGYQIPSSIIPSPSWDFHEVKIQSGEYAVLSAAGQQPAALIETWKSIWESDLARTYATDYEIYGPRFFDPAIQEVLIHIGVKEQGP